MRIFLWLMIAPILFYVSGCVTTQTLDDQYNTIDFSNGVGSDEAAIIAQKSLAESRHNHQYKIKTPRILKDAFVRDYKGHWFVSFDPKSFDLSFWRYLVVVEKKSGKIIFADTYIPYEVADYDWVFDASLKR